jgi:hypothetical protein
MDILISLQAGHLSPRDATLCGSLVQECDMGGRQLPGTLSPFTRSKQVPLLAAEEEDRDDIGCTYHHDVLA